MQHTTRVALSAQRMASVILPPPFAVEVRSIIGMGQRCPGAALLSAVARAVPAHAAGSLTTTVRPGSKGGAS